MATNLQIVPARTKGTKGHDNPVLNGSRFFKDRIRDDKTYWKCCLHKTHGCKARIQTIDKQLTSPVPGCSQYTGSSLMAGTSLSATDSCRGRQPPFT